LLAVWGGEVLSLPSDVLAFVRFLFVLTAAVSVFSLWTLKDAVLALFPRLRDFGSSGTENRLKELSNIIKSLTGSP